MDGYKMGNGKVKVGLDINFIDNMVKSWPISYSMRNISLPLELFSWPYSTPEFILVVLFSFLGL